MSIFLMRIITYNVNGIRSALRKGLLRWLEYDPADIICLQEIKAQLPDITTEIALIEQLGFRTYWYPARKKGYSGVAVLTRQTPEDVVYGNGRQQSDTEGRIIRLDYPAFTLVNAYFPSGTTGEVRQTYKYQWLEEFSAYLEELRATRPALVVCGDYNICHRAIDIHDPVRNKTSSGFLPEERAWMERLFDSGFVDTFRHFCADPHHYSWWSFRAGARDNNKGWRIDYINTTENLRDRLKHACIYPEVRHSDHCPVFLEFSE